MSQSFRSPFAASEALHTVLTSQLPDTLDALRTLFSGTSAPSSPVAGQLWHDTTSGVLYLRNQANDAWLFLLRTLGTAGRMLACSQLGDHTTAFTR